MRITNTINVQSIVASPIETSMRSNPTSETPKTLIVVRILILTKSKRQDQLTIECQKQINKDLPCFQNV